jgi:hypothetical protein
MPAESGLVSGLPSIHPHQRRLRYPLGIFQDGHLGALGTTATATLVANMPVLLFCIAFGLSMDYEVFLVSRMREYWLESGRTRADNDKSVALGLARTGRVVTAAALAMSISFAALIAAQVSFMRMFGLGLTVAVLVDAGLVRMLLLPAVMHVLGRANWSAPRPLVPRGTHRKVPWDTRSMPGAPWCVNASVEQTSTGANHHVRRRHLPGHGSAAAGSGNHQGRHRTGRPAVRRARRRTPASMRLAGHSTSGVASVSSISTASFT